MKVKDLSRSFNPVPKEKKLIEKQKPIEREKNNK